LGGGLVVRDARRCRAPHHEKDLILRSGASRVSKDEATELENVLTVIPLSGKTPTGKASRALPLRGRCGMIEAIE
jgi:hypothetical protein